MTPDDRYDEDFFNFAGTLTWFRCGENNNLAEAFGVPGFRGYLPFLLHEDDCGSVLNEQRLLLGVLYGLPQLKKGEAVSVPDDREQNEILSILMDRLMRGFGWKNKYEMIKGVLPYTLSFFDPRIF